MLAFTPAHGTCWGVQHTRMALSCRQVSCHSPRAHVHSTNRAWMLVVSNAGGVRVPKHAMRPQPPAHDPTGRQERTAVIIPDSDVRCCCAPKVNSPSSCRVLIVANELGVAVPKLATGPRTPTHDLSAREKHARVALSCSNSCCRAPPAQINLTCSSRVLVVTNVVEVAVSEPARECCPPAHDPTVRQHSTRVAVSSGNLCCSKTCTQVDSACSRWVLIVTNVVGVTIPKPAV